MALRLYYRSQINNLPVKHMAREPYKTWGLQHTVTALTPELIATEEGRQLIGRGFHPSGAENMLDDLERKAKKVLHDYGSDEDWRAHIGTHPDSLPEQAFHCTTILRHLWRVRHWLQENNASMAVFETILMMNAVADSMLTVFEPDIYRGKKTLKSASDGGKEKAAAYSALRDERQRMATEIWQRNPALSAREVAAIIVQKIGGEVETIRRQIKKDIKDS